MRKVAAEQFEYKTKDTVRLSGADWQSLAARDTGRDRLKDLHTAIDDYSRLAYAEVLTDEKATTAIGFLRRDVRFYRRFLKSLTRQVRYLRSTADLSRRHSVHASATSGDQ